MNVKKYFKHHYGFTLVELLVVIAIIAVLASLLLVTLSKVKEEGRKAGCISNSRNLTLAWQFFADDNNGVLPNTSFESCGQERLLWVSGYLNHYACRTESTNINLLINPQYAQFAPYITDPRIYKCPSDRKIYEIFNDDGESFVIRKTRSYSMNWSIGWLGPSHTPEKVFRKENEINNPSDLFIILDVNSDSICWSFFAIIKDLIFMYPAVYHNKMSVLSFADGHTGTKKWLSNEINLPRPKGNQFHLHREETKGNKDIEWLRKHSLYY